VKGQGFSLILPFPALKRPTDGETRGPGCGGGIGGNFCPASFLPSRDVLIDGDAGLQLMAGAARTCVQVAVWRFVVGA
jgi:hypothetical protein